MISIKNKSLVNKSESQRIPKRRQETLPKINKVSGWNGSMWSMAQSAMSWTVSTMQDSVYHQGRYHLIDWYKLRKRWAKSNGCSWHRLYFQQEGGRKWYLFLSGWSAAVRSGQRGGAGLRVPRNVAVLRCAADRQRPNRIGVTVAVAVVVVAAAISRCPHENRSFTVATLHQTNWFIHLFIHW